jgi:23S rRNA (guanine745-N1)-methyltransferase
MTPYYWRTSIEDKKKLEGLESLRTEIEFDCRVYRKQ